MTVSIYDYISTCNVCYVMYNKTLKLLSQNNFSAYFYYFTTLAELAQNTCVMCKSKCTICQCICGSHFIKWCRLGGLLGGWVGG